MSTIQPTPPATPAAPTTATTVARITSGAEILANTRPGATVQVQVVSVAPGGQVTLSAPGGEIQVQTSSSAPPPSQNQPQSQGPGRTPDQAQGRTSREGNDPGTGRGLVTLKPGDVYMLRTGPRGSETISLSPQRTAPPPPATQETSAPAPRAEGSVPTRLVPGAVTTATIIPRPGETAAPPPPTQQSAPAQATPPPNIARAYPPLPPATPPQPPAQPPSTGTGPAAPPAADGADVSSGRPGGPTAAATGLASLARAGTGALLRTALQAARAITDGAIRQPPSQADQSNASQSRGSAAAPLLATTTPAAGGAGGNPLPPNQAPAPASPGAVPANAAATRLSSGVANPAPSATLPSASTQPQTAAPPPPGGTTTGAPGPTTTLAIGATQTPGASHPLGTSQPPSAPTSAGAHPGQTPTSAPTGGGAASIASSPASTSTTQVPTPPSVAGAPAATPAGLVAQFAQIQRVDIRILSVQHPGATATNAASSAATPQGAVVGGTVIGLSRSGQSILSTPRGLMTLVGQAELPPGSRVVVEILPQSSRAGTARTAGPPPAPLAHLAQHWETLDQAIRLLEVANPSAANQITRDHVARPGPQLTAAIALFITAVRGGDLRAWLGEENTRALELARGGLGSTLREEFGTMQRASEPNDGGWRGFFIPFLDDGQLNQIRLFLHQERDARDNDEREGADPTRFVVDLSLSQLGDLQIDGTVRPETVDLLVRTRDALPTTMRQEIRDIFTSTLGRTGIDGQLAFRVQKTFPTLPIEELHGYQDSPTSDLHI